jgi:hypothetical protein
MPQLPLANRRSKRQERHRTNRRRSMPATAPADSPGRWQLWCECSGAVRQVPVGVRLLRRDRTLARRECPWAPWAGMRSVKLRRRHIQSSASCVAISSQERHPSGGATGRRHIEPTTQLQALPTHLLRVSHPSSGRPSSQEGTPTAQTAPLSARLWRKLDRRDRSM